MQIEHSNGEMLVFSTRTNKDRITHFIVYQFLSGLHFRKMNARFRTLLGKKEWLLFKIMKFVPLDGKTGLHTFRKLWLY